MKQVWKMSRNKSSEDVIPWHGGICRTIWFAIGSSIGEFVEIMFYNTEITLGDAVLAREKYMSMIGHITGINLICCRENIWKISYKLNQRFWQIYLQWTFFFTLRAINSELKFQTCSSWTFPGNHIFPHNCKLKQCEHEELHDKESKAYLEEGEHIFNHIFPSRHVIVRFGVCRQASGYLKRQKLFQLGGFWPDYYFI